MSDLTAREPLSVLRAFLRLGVTSFGGPIAHLGYLRTEFVERRAWLSEAQFAQLLAICQLLPGPASSQLGFAIGWLRAGWPGAVAAFVGFTMPSVLLLLGVAQLAATVDSALGACVRHGLGLVAVAVVAHGVIRMMVMLTPDTSRRLIGVAAAIAMLVASSAAMQIVVIAGGALAGWLFCRTSEFAQSVSLPAPISPRTASIAFSVFVLLLVVALVPALQPGTQITPTLPALAAAFYRAGALVFGGGHVVLPLLETSLVNSGWMTAEQFLAGYGAAQAIPGPLFSVAAFFGATLATGSHPLIVSLIALVAVFLPGFLLVVAILPVWSGLARQDAAPRVLAGVNAAVVGLLAAALYDPVLTSAISHSYDVLIAGIGLAVLLGTRRSPLWVVAWCVLATAVMRQIVV